VENLHARLFARRERRDVLQYALLHLQLLPLDYFAMAILMVSQTNHRLADDANEHANPNALFSNELPSPNSFYDDVTSDH
jgi:hypothetical protein